MIRVQCSKLEEIRKNPSLFVQKLIFEESTNGGSIGMFKRWQNKVKAIHSTELDIPGAIKKLQQEFLNYSDNAKNRKKQEFLLDRLYSYLEEFKTKGFIYKSAEKRIFWDIIEDVALTGNSPVLVSKEDGSKHFAYYFTEAPSSWQQELKYPLLQKYLSEEYFKCNLGDLQVGVYCLQTNKFELQCFSTEDVNAAILEAQTLFNGIYRDYLTNSQEKRLTTKNTEIFG
jgi:hypothetical protein